MSAAISTVSLLLNLFGSIILAYSLSKCISVINTSLDAIEFSVERLATPNADVPIFIGLDEHRKNAQKTSSCLTKLGLAFLFFGIVLQIVMLFNSLKLLDWVLTLLN